MNSINNAIEEKFKFLFENYGFEIVLNEINGMSFMTIIENNRIKLKFIKDRADFFLDICRSSDENNWKELYAYLKLLRQKNLILEDIKVINTVESIKSVLKTNIEILIKNSELLEEV